MISGGRRAADLGVKSARSLHVFSPEDSVHVDIELGGLVAKKPKPIGKGSPSRILNVVRQALEQAVKSGADVIVEQARSTTKDNARAIAALCKEVGLYKSGPEDFTSIFYCTTKNLT